MKRLEVAFTRLLNSNFAAVVLDFLDVGLYFLDIATDIQVLKVSTPCDQPQDQEANTDTQAEADYGCSRFALQCQLQRQQQSTPCRLHRPNTRQGPMWLGALQGPVTKQQQQ
jgi:hypothetical protein